MNLYYSILIAIWLAVVYAIWAATAAGDPGYGQVAFLAGGIFATLYLMKRNKEMPRIDLDKIEIPEACLLYTSPSPRDATLSRMPSSA